MLRREGVFGMIFTFYIQIFGNPINLRHLLSNKTLIMHVIYILFRLPYFAHIHLCCLLHETELETWHLYQRPNQCHSHNSNIGEIYSEQDR